MLLNTFSDWKISKFINRISVTCHQITKREVDEEGYDWDNGAPRYEHMHFMEDGEIDFSPRIIGGTPSFQGEYPAKVDRKILIESSMK